MEHGGYDRIFADDVDVGKAWVLYRHASASLLIRLDASGLVHAKRNGVFASVPNGTAPRFEAAEKPCKSGKAIQQHPSLPRQHQRRATVNHIAIARAPVVACTVASALRS